MSDNKKELQDKYNTLEKEYKKNVSKAANNATRIIKNRK
jgi:hypothetical protein